MHHVTFVSSIRSTRPPFTLSSTLSQSFLGSVVTSYFRSFHQDRMHRDLLVHFVAQLRGIIEFTEIPSFRVTSLGGDDLSTSLYRKRRASIMSMEGDATTILPKDSPVEIRAVHSAKVNLNDTRVAIAYLSGLALAGRACRYPGEILFVIEGVPPEPARKWALGQLDSSRSPRRRASSSSRSLRRVRMDIEGARRIGGQAVGRDESRKRIGGGGGGFASHPILVTPSFLTVG